MTALNALTPQIFRFGIDSVLGGDEYPFFVGTSVGIGALFDRGLSDVRGFPVSVPGEYGEDGREVCPKYQGRFVRPCAKTLDEVARRASDGGYYTAVYV